MSRFRVVWPLLFVVLGPALARSDEGPPLPPPLVLEEFDVVSDGDLLMVPVRLGDRSYPFVVDTGCTCSIVDVALLGGKPLRTERMNGIDAPASKEVKLYKAPTLGIGKIAWTSPEPIVGEDLSALRRVSGHDFQGLLGMDFLRGYALHIDFDLGKLRLLSSPARLRGHTLPIVFPERTRTRPFIVADIGGWGPEQFQIDTGDTGFGNLRKDLFRALSRDKVIQDLTENKACTIAGTRKHYGGFIERFEVAGTQHRGGAFSESAFLQSDLGLRLWRRYNLIFDFPEQTFTFQKSLRFGDKDWADYGGMSLAREQGKTMVEEVKKKSPAWRAGIRAGDVVLSVAGKKAASVRLMEMGKILSQQGDKVPIVYRHDGQRREVVLHLQPWKEKPPRLTFLKQEEPKHVRVSLLVERGFAHGLKNDCRRAIADFDEALHLDPANVDAYVARARARQGERDFTRALADLGKAGRLEPMYPALYFLRARVHMVKGDLAAALDEYEELLRLDPRNPGALQEASRVHGTKKDWPRALALLDQAIRLDPGNAEALALRGAYLASLGQYEKAIVELDRAIALDRYCSLAFANRGAILASQRHSERALADLDEAVQLGHRSAQCYLIRALLYQERKEYARVIANLGEAVRHEPDNAMARHGLAWSLVHCPDEKLRNARQAVIHGKKSCELTRREDPAMLETLAAAHAACGAFPDAVRCQQEAVRLYTDRGAPPELARTRLASYQRARTEPDLP